jgi:hypothetical protein
MTDETEEDFMLKLTGKTTIIFELEEFNPISIGINDIELSTKLIKFLLDNSVEDFNVEVSTDEMIERHRKVLDEIK